MTLAGSVDAARTSFAELTTLRVGGPIARVERPTDRAGLVAAVLERVDAGEDWIVLGGGSNVVGPDEGYDGTAILTAGVLGVESVAADDGRIHLRVAAGERWDDVVAHAVDRGLTGIEALSGIPGSAGAAPIQNIGAYGQELSDSLIAIEFLDAETGAERRVDAADLGLGYRASALKRGRAGVVLAIEVALRPARVGVVAYEQLASALGVDVGAEVALADIRAAVLGLRASKGMLDDSELPSCGSFFVNPIVDENWARSLPADAPRWPVGEEEADAVASLDAGPEHRVYPDRREVKLSAAWLIERAGVGRGWRLPGSRAGISPKHTLAIVNLGGATAREVVQLAEFVQSRVAADFGVNLQPEPVILRSADA